MLEYLLKSSACLAILCAFYKLFLEKESMHSFKRYFLLMGLMASLTIPLITVDEYVEIAQKETYIPFDIPQFENEEIQANNTIQWADYLLAIYLLGVLLFGTKFIYNLRKMLFSIHKNQKVQKPPFVYVLIENLTVPHTFFSYIFLNKADYFENSIPEEIIVHEETHAREKHSIDIIFAEVLQILFWINPFIYFIKNSIRLNHEFIADRAVMASKGDMMAYQNLLLAFSSTKHHSLSNSFNKLSLKKRFIAMKTQTSYTMKLLKGLAVIALFAALFYGFAEKNKVFVETETFAARQNNEARLSIKVYNDNEISIDGKEALGFERFKKEISKLSSFLKTEQKNNYVIGLYAEAEVEMAYVSRVKEVLTSLGFKKFKYLSQKVTKAYQQYSPKNNYAFMVPEAPPAPNPDPVEYVKELAKRGARFYIGPHEYELEKVIEMVQKRSTEVTIDVSSYPEVRLGGC